MIDPAAPILGLILAGGQSQRMGGGDKCLRDLGGQPIIAHAINRFQEQVERMVINANGDRRAFSNSICPWSPTACRISPGLSPAFWLGWIGRRTTCRDALTWSAFRATARSCPGTSFAACGPRCRWAPRSPRRPAPARSIPSSVSGRSPCATRCVEALTVEKVRKVDEWTARFRREIVQFSAVPVDPFFNANTPEDLATAERLLKVPH